MSYSKPEQMNDQEFYISVLQGQTAALPCRVQSVPPPTLRSGLNIFIALSNIFCLQLVPCQQQPATAGVVQYEDPLGGPHVVDRGRQDGGRGPIQVHGQERDGGAQCHASSAGRASAGCR